MVDQTTNKKGCIYTMLVNMRFYIQRFKAEIKTTNLLFLLIYISACVPLNDSSMEDIVGETKNNRLYSGSSESSAFGPLKRVQPDQRVFKLQQDCPEGEELYNSEIGFNTFEIGIIWNLNDLIEGNRKQIRGYSSYRCIPR